MPAVTGSKRRAVVNRVGLYLGLSAFGLLMLFPFAVVAFGSLKTVSDVNRYPPRLLPATQDTVEVDGEELDLYVIEGQERVLVERVDIGVFAPPDDLEATFSAPTRDAERRGGFLDTETVVVDGEEYELYDVTVGGTVIEGRRPARHDHRGHLRPPRRPRRHGHRQRPNRADGRQPVVPDRELPRGHRAAGAGPQPHQHPARHHPGRRVARC
jgi:hypothetical protein